MKPPLPRFIPREIRELIAFVPVRGWDAIAWRPLLAQLRRITWQLASGDGIATLRKSLQPLLPELPLEAPAQRARAWSSLSARTRQDAGDAVLRLYFTQWRNPQGLFLDLRPSRFQVADNRLHFLPGALWTRLDEDFRLGMIDLYLGFYRDDATQLDRALRRMGLLHENLSPQAAVELRQLLRAHFGAQSRQQQFAIEAFRESFDALFDFFLRHDYQLRSDFVLLGFYLISLYLTLEALGARHDVQALCLECLGPLKAARSRA